MAPAADPRVQRIVERFESLSPGDLDRLGELYAPDARFKDPFNDVRGVDAIRRVFAHMFATLENPRFEVLDAAVDGDRTYLGWNFRFGLPRWLRREACIGGVSRLRLDGEGRIAEHVDYWDPAEGLYEKLPAVGALMRWLRRRAAADAAGATSGLR